MRLNDKQRAVFDLLLQHYPAVEIAEKLGLASATIDDRIRAARVRYGGVSRAEAIRLYAQDLSQSPKDATSIPSGDKPFGAVDLAQAILRSRQQRFELFDGDLFGEPGWDILLALFVAKAQGAALDAQSLVGFAQSSPETTERWLSLLVDRKVIQKAAAGGDDRYTLSGPAETTLQRQLEEWSAHLASASAADGIRMAKQKERSHP